MSGVLRILAVVTGGLVILAGVLLMLPTATGYAYVGFMWPGFDYTCPPSKGYEPAFGLFLRARPCLIDDALQQAAVDESFPGGGERLKALWNGAPATSADEVASLDAMRYTLKTFRVPKSPSDCPEDVYCAIQYWWSDDIVSNLFSAAGERYEKFFIPSFWKGVDDATVAYTRFESYGPLARGALYVGYIILLAVVASGLFEGFKSLIKN